MRYRVRAADRVVGAELYVDELRTVRGAGRTHTMRFRLRSNGSFDLPQFGIQKLPQRIMAIT
jgi:hypothetical protein